MKKVLLSFLVIGGMLLPVSKTTAATVAGTSHGSNFTCLTSCHELHGSGGSPLLGGADAQTTCLSCHGPGGIATKKAAIHTPANLAPDVVTCLECHNPHSNRDYTLNGTDPAGTNVQLIGVEYDFHDDTAYPFATIREVTTSGLGAAKNVAFASVGPNDWTRPDGLGLCQACHAAPHNEGQDCTGCHKHDAGFAGSGACDSCHDINSGHATAPLMFDKSGGTHAGEPYGGHLKATTADVLSPTTDWAVQCGKCHGAHAGDYMVPNKAAVGIQYNSHGGIWLGGTATVASPTFEAEICWGCHEAADPDISEWGLNSGGTYDYGSVDIDDLNWTTTNWQSAVFSYKDGPLGTRPTDGDNTELAGPGAGTGGDSASLHANAGTVGTQSNDVTAVSCSYCHDVHSVMGPTGKPYLRGSWTRNLYPEDGAPQSGDTWSDATPFSKTDNVPRGMNTQNGSGGYQIDQNNPTIDHSAYDYATDDALCHLCHTTDGATTGFVGTYPLHRNIIPGFVNDGATPARNLFQRSQRSTANDRYDPWIAYFGITNYYDSKGWMGGFREEAAGNPISGIGIVPGVDGQAKAYDDFSWGVTVDDGTVDVDFHNFTCSKCHNPHASRLPRLMISNCLDVQRNTWDDDYMPGGSLGSSAAVWANWPNLTPSSGNEGHQEIAYANTAQNCHRYFPAQSGTGTGAYEGGGWNKVTPW